MTRWILAAVLALTTALGFPTPASAQRNARFAPDDWITLRDFRFVTSVAVSDQAAYFGSTAGLQRFDTLRDVWLSPVTTADGLPNEHITALAAQANGDVWIGTRRGVVRFLEFTGEIDRVFGPPPTIVDALRVDRDTGTMYAFVAGSWWAGRAGSPVMERSAGPPAGSRGSVDVEDLDPFDVPWNDPLYVRSTIDRGQLVRLTGVDRDFRGDFYVGTWGDNGRRWGAARFDWEPLRFGLAGRGGGPIVRAGDGLWLAPIGHPRYARRVLDAPLALAHAPPTGDWRYVEPRTTPGLPTAMVHVGAAVADTLYFGSDFGLTRFDGDAWKTWGWNADAPLDAVYALGVDGDRLWVGTARGLVAWDRASERPAAQFLEGRSVTALAVAPDAIFVGTTTGLFVGTREGPAAHPESFVRSESPGGRIRALALRDTMLVVATGTGLGVYDRRDGGWRFISPLEGRLDAVPLSLAIDSRQVWIGTERGLVRWEPATDEWITYRPEDGLAGVPVLHLLAEEDAVWASTPEGVSRFGWPRAPR